jgi:YcxB-like protein
VRAQYRISEDDYVKATKLYGKLTPRSIAVLLVAMLLLVCLIVFGSTVVQAAGISGLVTGLSIFFLGQYVLSPWIARRHYRKYKAIQEEFSIEIMDDGFSLRTADSDAKIKWANVLKWRHNDEFILVFPMPRIYYMVPKSLATSGLDIALLIAKLTDNVGNPT